VEERGARESSVPPSSVPPWRGCGRGGSLSSLIYSNLLEFARTLTLVRRLVLSSASLLLLLVLLSVSLALSLSRACAFLLSLSLSRLNARSISLSLSLSMLSLSLTRVRALSCARASSQMPAYSRSLLPPKWVSFDTCLVCARAKLRRAHPRRMNPAFGFDFLIDVDAH